MPLRGEVGEEFLPVVNDLPLKVLPIVEPGPTQIVIIDAKPQGPHQPQLGSHRDARAADAPRVVRDLRLIEHHVQLGRVPGGHGYGQTE
jgi:hypothetical protein